MQVWTSRTNYDCDWNLVFRTKNWSIVLTMRDWYWRRFDPYIHFHRFGDTHDPD
jgi:hypothetical protein